MNISDVYSIFKRHPFICTDTREITKGSIFFALKGENFNGNKFAEKAIDEGCAYAIIDEEDFCKNNKIILVENALVCLQKLAKHHREQLPIPIIGITGTNGKTTSKELIHAVLKSEMNCFATKGNLNNHIGVPLSILEMTKSTEIGIIEMGANHQYEIEFLCNIVQPTHAVITNIGLAHLEGFGDLQGVIDTKNELYKYISKTKGYVFVNSADDMLVKLSEGIKRATYGKTGMINATIANTTPFISINYKNELIKSKLIGNYQFDNIILSICIGNHFNISLQNIKQAIEEYTPENNRSQMIETANNKLILDAYNANPSSMGAMLYSFAEQEYTNKICILGDMLELGSHSAYEHQKIFNLCKELNLQCYFIGVEFNKTNNKSFISKNSFEQYLKDNPIANKTILLKGSRGVELEKLITLL